MTSPFSVPEVYQMIEEAHIIGRSYSENIQTSSTGIISNRQRTVAFQKQQSALAIGKYPYRRIPLVPAQHVLTVWQALSSHIVI